MVTTPKESIPRKSSGALTGGGMLLAGIALGWVGASALRDAFDSIGAVDRNIEAIRFVASLLGAIVAALGSSTLLKALLPRLQWIWNLTIAAVVASVVMASTIWLVVNRPEQEFMEGALTSGAPFATRTLLSGGNGFRYYVTFTPSESLKADLSIRGAGSSIPGELQPDGRTVVAEGVLVGDTTWTAQITYTGGTGRYLLYVNSAGPEELTMSPAQLARAFDAGRSRAGYVFVATEDTDVYLHVESTNTATASPGMLLRDSDGTPIDNVPIGGNGTIFTKIRAGTYVLAVQGATDQRFGIVFDATNPSNPADKPTDRVTVPDVSNKPGQDSSNALTDAGFVVQTVPVCSDSLAASGAAEGTTRQVVLAGAPTAAEEVEVVSAKSVKVADLPVGTVLDIKTFNGKSCSG